MQPPHESLADFPVIVPVSLHWGDQDAFGHVNNTMYLRCAETARVEYLTRVGAWQRPAPSTIGPILASISCDYRLPLTYPDAVYVGARITRIGNSSIKMAHKIVSAGRNAVAADLDSTMVWFDYVAGKSIPVPAELRDAIANLEGGLLAFSR